MSMTKLISFTFKKFGMRSIGLFLLGLIDFLTGVFLIFGIKYQPLGIISIGKGAWTIITSLSSIGGIILGSVDFIGGLSLYFYSIGIESWLFYYIGIIVAIKGIYSMIFSF